MDTFCLTISEVTMGNTSSLRKAMLKNDVAEVQSILDEAGDGAPDLINEDYTSDCLCSRDRNVQTPLYTAIGRDFDGVVKVMLQYGGDINTPGLWGQTGLHLAAKRNNVTLCKLIVEYGADLKAEDRVGKRPIHAAAISFVANRAGNTDALKYVLEEIGEPDDVHLQDVDGRTPLHDAAKYGHTLAVEYLLLKGADPLGKNNTGKTPLDEAQMNSQYDTIKLLEKAGKK